MDWQPERREALCGALAISRAGARLVRLSQSSRVGPGQPPSPPAVAVVRVPPPPPSPAPVSSRPASPDGRPRLQQRAISDVTAGHPSTRVGSAGGAVTSRHPNDRCRHLSAGYGTSPRASHPSQDAPPSRQFQTCPRPPPAKPWSKRFAEFLRQRITAWDCA